MKHCPKCNSLMPEDAMRCIRCGFDSRPSFARPAAACRAVAQRASDPAPGAVAGEKLGKRGRLRSGWALARQSLRILMLDKQLLVFPLLSGSPAAAACQLRRRRLGDGNRQTGGRSRQCGQLVPSVRLLLRQLFHNRVLQLGAGGLRHDPFSRRGPRWLPACAPRRERIGQIAAGAACRERGRDLENDRGARSVRRPDRDCAAGRGLDYRQLLVCRCWWSRRSGPSTPSSVRSRYSERPGRGYCATRAWIGHLSGHLRAPLLTA